MTRQFQCKGCHHERTEPESEHARKGYCSACNAKGVGLPQIKKVEKVEKYEARDGTLHDSLDLAEKHQLMQEVTTALRTCEGRTEQQARHLLSHFDIVRKGDKLPTKCEPRDADQGSHFGGYVLGFIVGASFKRSSFWSFFIGATLATSVMLYMFR